ncbi:hypothetical protein M422DRAFT_249611 [Sphaerobolus stellatus SS14]|uniref:Allantoinase n=1 Tax=Sphaerobolus stellatus (strain SS14) TaxID=990650 RepID=A0A0C9W3X4_SPHS4|nr:hypothetical protein M422DRAFT_249611 [Sphaerobolus stellatus SS14]
MLTSSEIPAGHPEFKCCPPIRTQGNREELWKAFQDGTLDFVVSDHSPCVAEFKCLKSGGIMKAWGGMGGLGRVEKANLRGQTFWDSTNEGNGFCKYPFGNVL